MKGPMVLAVLVALSSCPAVAQNRTSSGATPPPGGSFQGYTESRQTPQEQAQAGVSTETPSIGTKDGSKRHPGTLRKFNSNAGYGPEVQFEVDRREAQQKSQK